ncbi:SGNH family lipase [Paractinoplanes ferrugineus]|uniref:Lipase 1 n=1 Tax=Paractinoplanes ferrugineus TaxID=113564 RepID=A0A919MG15_9ACTN|nr:SGNH/GDSL hydrolase family protein [Actinoplanes ferrugineus]GIE14373.1 lipase 1 [Actinoplanes ferrugineus]
MRSATAARVLLPSLVRALVPALAVVLGPALAGVLAGVLAATLVGAPARAGDRQGSPRYVSLGDSYSAGVGSGGSESGGRCRRNTNAYPARWAKAHSGYDAVLGACSGADVAAVRLTQLAALTRDTTLVTLTAGGNDIGFARTMTGCVLDPRTSACVARTHTATRQAREVLPDRLRQLYAAIRDRSPKADVLVLGYPRFFRSARAGCRFLNGTERASINDTIDVLNAVLRERATAAGFHFVEVTSRFTGHGLCAGTPWLHGVTFPTDNSFHPTDAGQRDGYLPAMTAAAP